MVVDTLYQLRVGRIAGDDRFFGSSAFKSIEAKVSFPRIFVESVAEKAVFRENCPDVPIVGKQLLFRSPGHRSHRAQEDDQQGSWKESTHSEWILGGWEDFVLDWS